MTDFNICIANIQDFDRRAPVPASARPTPAPALSGASALADLALFWVSGPMVLISPVQIHDALVRYSDRLFQRSPTIVCLPQTTGLDLAGAAAVDPAVVGAIVDAVGSQKCILRPWGALPGIYDLLATLTRAGLDVDAHAFPLREDLLTVQQLDSKVGFRRFVTGTSDAGGQVHMPAGEICGSIDEVVASLEPLLARDGRAVLKSELGTAGSGVIIVDANSTDTSGTELRPYIEARMAQRPALFYSGPYVVEAFVGPSGETEDLSHGATFVTVFIHSDGMFETLGAARERRNTHNRIAAVEVGRDSGPANTPDMFDESVRTLCAAAAAIGYRGSAIFDFLLDSHADPAVIEMNARRGTAGFVFTLAQALFGPDWTNRHSGLIRLPLHVEPSERLNPDRVLDVIETTNQSLSGDAVIVPVSLTWLKLPNPGVAIVTFGSDRTAISEAESGLSEWLAQVS